MIREEKVQIKKNHHVGCWVVLLLLLAVVGGIGFYQYKIYSEEREYEQGEQEAWLNIERFDRDDMLDSLLRAVKHYQRHYPDGRHAEQVINIRMRVDSEQRDWKQVVQNLSIDNLEDFIRQHSDGYFRKYASSMIDSLLFLEAKDEDTYKAYRSYVAGNEEGRYVRQAVKRMKQLAAGSVGKGEAIAAEGTVRQHFEALATANNQLLLATLAQDVNSYIGKPNATHTDIVRYMASMHEDVNREIEFTFSDMNTSKQIDDDRISFTVSFSFDELIRLDGDETTRSFTGIAHLNSDMLITSLAFKTR